MIDETKKHIIFAAQKITNIARVAGITLERTANGRANYARINLRKHSEFIPLLEEKGLDVEPPIKWTAKMKRSMAQAKNGEIYEVDMNNFWNI